MWTTDWSRPIKDPKHITVTALCLGELIQHKYTDSHTIGLTQSHPVQAIKHKAKLNNQSSLHIIYSIPFYGQSTPNQMLHQWHVNHNLPYHTCPLNEAALK